MALYFSSIVEDNVALVVDEIVYNMVTYKSRHEWDKAVNNTINSALHDCYPRSWSEDLLTESILKALKKSHSNVVIAKDKLFGRNIKCRWDIYKNTRKLGMEEKHGDIGVLVQLHFQKNASLEGVAFLEAKRMYDPEVSNAYLGAFKQEQLERINSNSSFHRTLIYDIRLREPTNSPQYLRPLSLTLPTRHLLTIKTTTRDIYRYCEYLSSCLISRYLQGYELDYDPKIVNSVKGFLDTIGGVDYLIVAETALHPDLELDPNHLKINDNIYTPLDPFDMSSDSEIVFQ